MLSLYTNTHKMLVQADIDKQIWGFYAVDFYFFLILATSELPSFFPEYKT